MEAMEKELYKAAINGDTKALLELLEKDKLLLERFTLNSPNNETPLHIAAMRGHTELAKAILDRDPRLSTEKDSRGLCPLHIASARGDLEMVKLLVLVNSAMCSARDRGGQSPLHLAAAKGRVAAAKELVRAEPMAVKHRTSSGEMVLHVCVRHNRFEVLEMLMVEKSVVEVGDEILNATDSDGNTILHLAVLDKQVETIKYLLKNSRIEVNSVNTHGQTALDILTQGRKETSDFEIGEMLREAGALRAKEIPDIHHHHHHHHRQPKTNKSDHKPGDWLSRKRDSIMVVASLIATMAFQAGINPPGGVWQDNSPSDSPNPHRAGEAVMAYNHTNAYRYFVRANTTAFVASLSTILLLISGLPFRRRFFMWCLMVIMWLTVTTNALSYGISIVIVTPKRYRAQLSNVIQISVTVWCCVMALLLLGNTIRLIFRWMKKNNKIDYSNWPLIKRSTSFVHANV